MMSSMNYFIMELQWGIFNALFMRLFLFFTMFPSEQGITSYYNLILILVMYEIKKISGQWQKTKIKRVKKVETSCIPAVPVFFFFFFYHCYRNHIYFYSLALLAYRDEECS